MRCKGLLQVCYAGYVPQGNAVDQIGAAIQQVDMGILKPRQNQPPAPVQPARGRSGQGQDVGVCPQRQNDAARNGKRLRLRAGGIHGPDAPIQQDQVRCHPDAPLRGASSKRSASNSAQSGAGITRATSATSRVQPNRHRKGTGPTLVRCGA